MCDSLMHPRPHQAAFLVCFLALLGCNHDEPSPSTFQVVSIDPADGITAVPLTNTIQVTFSADVHADSIMGTHNILVVDSSNQPLQGVFSVSEAVVTFSATGGLPAEETIGVAVRSTVFDLEGVSLRYPRAVRFSTGTSVESIPGFPPFDEYPPAPDSSKISAEVRGAVTEVEGAVDAVTRPGEHSVAVNARNLTLDGDWVTVQPTSYGSFTADLPGGDEGDQIEINVSYLDTKKVGPSIVAIAVFPFSWGLIGAAGAAPQARQGHCAVYDETNHRMVLFGGCTNTWGFGGTLADVFSLSLAEGAETWTQLSPSGGAPSARWGHSAVYDGPRNRMIIFGGDTGALGVLNDVWTLSLTPGAETWTPLAPIGTPPEARALHAAVYDSVGKRMIVFGGRNAGVMGTTAFDDLYALDLPDTGTPGWQLLSPSGIGPSARYGAFGVMDVGGNRVVAGFGTDGVFYYPETYTLDLSGSAWAPVTNVPASSGRSGACAALDTVRQRVLVFGGRDGSSGCNELFAFDLGTGTWGPLAPEGSSPPLLSGASMIFEPVQGRAVLFGGRDDSTVLSGLYQLR